MEDNIYILNEALSFVPIENTIHLGSNNVKLPPKVSDLLLCLVNNPNEVLSRDQLLSEVWPDRHGADESLSRAISELRRAFQTLDPTAKTWLITVPKKGYKLEVNVVGQANKHDIPVANADQEKHTSSPQISYLLAAIVGIIGCIIVAFYTIYETDIKVEPKSIAVLVLDNLSNDDSLDDVALGLTEEILHVLVNNTNMRVIARTTSQYIAKNNIAIKNVAEQLDITHLVEGSIRVQDDILRVTIQLIETQTESHIWSKNFEYTYNNTISIQDDVAKNILNSFTEKPYSIDDLALANEVSVQLQKRYLAIQGKLTYLKPEQLVGIQEELQGILQINPDYNNAKILLSIVLSMRANWVQISASEAISSSNELLNGLEEKYSEDAMFWLAKGMMYAPRATQPKAGNPELAAKYYEKGFRIAPDYYLLISNYQSLASKMGQVEKYNELAELGLKLAPYDLTNLEKKIFYENGTGNYAAAELSSKKLIQLDPSRPIAYINWGFSLRQQKRFTEMDQAIQQCLEVDPKFMNCWEYKLYVHIRAGQQQHVNAILKSLGLFAPPAAGAIDLMYLVNNMEFEKAFAILKSYSPEDMGKSFIAQQALTIFAHVAGKTAPSSTKETIEQYKKNALAYVNTDNARKFNFLLSSDAPELRQKLEERLTELQNMPNKSDNTRYSIVEYLALLGRNDEAIKLLHSLVQNDYVPWYMWRFYRLENNPFLITLQDHQQYANILSLYQRKRQEFAVELKKTNKTEALLQSLGQDFNLSER